MRGRVSPRPRFPHLPGIGRSVHLHIAVINVLLLVAIVVVVILGIGIGAFGMSRYAVVPALNPPPLSRRRGVVPGRGRERDERDERDERGVNEEKERENENGNGKKKLTLGSRRGNRQPN